MATNGTIDVSAQLQAILEAVYGEQVRGSIYNAIKEIADECNAWLEHQAGSVTTTALADEAVTTPKIYPGAVNRDSIADNAVSMSKLAANIGLHKNSNDILLFGGAQT